MAPGDSPSPHPHWWAGSRGNRKRRCTRGSNPVSPWEPSVHSALPTPTPALQRAVEVMCIVPKRCNDMMNVGRLQGFDVMRLFSFELTSDCHHFLVARVLYLHLLAWVSAFSHFTSA